MVRPDKTHPDYIRRFGVNGEKPKPCPFCKGTGYRMSRVFLGKLLEEIANELYGGGCDSSHWPETLELAYKIIEMVRDHDLDT